MEVHLLARVIFMDVHAISLDLVHRVLNAKQAPRRGMLSNSNRVPQAPPETEALGIETIATAGNIVQVERLDLAMAGGEHSSLKVHVGSAASADHEDAIDLL